MKIYVISWGCLVSVDVLKETEKSYMVDVDSKERIVGGFGYVSKWVKKSSVNSSVFTDLGEALDSLEGKTLGSIKNKEQEIARLSRKLEEIESIRQLLED